jgi:hypothetical protein
MSPDRARFAIHPDQTLKLNIKVRRVLTTVVMKRIEMRGIFKAATGDKSELNTDTGGSRSMASRALAGGPPAGIHRRPSAAFQACSTGREVGGTATRDPHHGDPADEEFSPSVLNGKSAADIKKSIADFSIGFQSNTAPPGAGRASTTVTTSRSK